MMPGNVFGRPAGTEVTETMESVAGPLTGLRHLSAAAEPARVFTDLAAVCVPALCDECVIEIVEQGGHRYRIRRPGPGPAHAVAATDRSTDPAAIDGGGLGEQ